MCIIIDANRAGITFCDAPHVDCKPVLKWIDEGEGKLITGGKLLAECAQNLKYKRWLKTRAESGKAHIVPKNRIDNEISLLEKKGDFKSNDIHIVALAAASGARLLFSTDKDLHQDFTNPKFLSAPRGKIYQTADHKHLLNKKACMDCA